MIQCSGVCEEILFSATAVITADNRSTDIVKFTVYMQLATINTA